MVIFLGSDVTPLAMSSSSLFHPCFSGELGDGDVRLNVLAAQWGVLAPWGVFSIIIATPVPLAHVPSFCDSGINKEKKLKYSEYSTVLICVSLAFK